MACSIFKLAIFSWFLFIFHSTSNANESGYFQITPNTRLITSSTAVVKVATSQFECGLWCSRLGRPSCRSFNLEKQKSGKNGRKCELLSVDGKERSGTLKESDDFDHFHLMAQCSPNPCQNGGQCEEKDGGTNYVCTCPYFNTYGKNCELHKCVLFDFESGRLDGWTLTGTAFNNQPTYGDNAFARREWSANLRGSWYVGTVENRPSPSHPAGERQGNGPTGTATSPPFVIGGTKLRLLVGGGADVNTERVELLIGGSVVATVGSTQDNDTMVQKEIDVTSWRGQVAQVRIIDDSSGIWGIINVDRIEDSICSE